MTKQLKENKSLNFWQKHSKTIIDWIVFAIGTIACCFTRFTFNMWFCVLIYPACFLFFERRQKAYIGLPTLFLSTFLASGISAWKLVISEGVGLQLALDLILSLLILIPFILDKLVYCRFYSKHPLVLSFLFPLTWVVIDLILGLTPIGNIPSLAYCLCQIIHTTTIISFLGMNFLTFVIMYFGCVLAQFAIDWKANIKAMIISASLVSFSLVYSCIYNVVGINENTTSIKVMTAYSTNDSTSEDRTKISVTDSINWLNIDVAKAKNTNSELLVYPEEAFWLYESEETQFKDAIKQVAIDNNLYIITGLEIDKNETEDTHRNIAWIVQPDGSLIEYTKTHLVPFCEEGCKEGNGDIKYVDIPNKGRIGVVICMDLEFPTYISKVGRLGCDTLIAPSWDWDTMHTIHTYSTMYRAVENGVNFVRCTETGRTVACDYKGNIISQYYTDSKDECKATHDNHVFNLPMKGRKTAYSYLAPGINYIYPVAFVILIVVFAIKDYAFKNKNKKANKNEN